MDKVKIPVLALRQAAQVEVRTAEEALEALRKLWREDEGVKKLLEQAARRGYTLVQTRDVEPAFTAAIRVAIARLRERLGEEKPSTLVVRGGKGKEERKPMFWESPEGVRYRVEPYDLTPREEKYWSYRDKRVEDAAKWVEQFLAMAEYEEAPSLLEDALEHEDNPHFRRDLIPEDLEAELRLLGWDGTLRNLQALVDTLPAREKAFVERVRSITALVDRRGGKAEVVAVKTPLLGWEVREAAPKPVVNAAIAIGVLQTALEKEDWRTGELRRWVEHVEPFVPGLLQALDAIATLRRAKHLLDQLGRGRRIAVYRDPATGEAVYRTPVI